MHERLASNSESSQTLRAASSPTTNDGVARSQADPIKHVIDADIPQSGNFDRALLELSGPAWPPATQRRLQALYLWPVLSYYAKVSTELKAEGLRDLSWGSCASNIDPQTLL